MDFSEWVIMEAQQGQHSDCELKILLQFRGKFKILQVEDDIGEIHVTR